MCYTHKTYGICFCNGKRGTEHEFLGRFSKRLTLKCRDVQKGLPCPYDVMIIVPYFGFDCKVCEGQESKAKEIEAEGRGGGGSYYRRDRGSRGQDGGGRDGRERKTHPIKRQRRAMGE